MKAKTDRALKAFYGTRDVARPQEVFTPEYLLQPMYEIWGGIGLDPCSHPDAPILAQAKWMGTPTAWRDGDPIEWNGKIPTAWAQVPCAWEGRGLIDPWTDRTYCNPPFGDLKAWLAYARDQVGRIAVLAPARVQRPWLRAVVRNPKWSTVALNSVTFHGYSQAFPQALLIFTTDKRLAMEYEILGLGEML